MFPFSHSDLFSSFFLCFLFVSDLFFCFWILRWKSVRLISCGCCMNFVQYFDTTQSLNWGEKCLFPHFFSFNISFNVFRMLNPLKSTQPLGQCTDRNSFTKLIELLEEEQKKIHFWNLQLVVLLFASWLKRILHTHSIHSLCQLLNWIKFFAVLFECCWWMRDEFVVSSDWCIVLNISK